ncbi:MAG TPA: SAM-dependent methyltransferase [Burkholderiales bacterium]|nr:SAM-dependent methyltransferase [Burkholderiales bacterium]
MPATSPNTDLPLPDEIAAAHSREVTACIAREIAAAGGWIPFARYMELALYQPGLGYYAAGARKLGAEGDFTTAPEISPLFARALARQIGEAIEATGDDVIELGAGTGRLAAGLLNELAALGRLPARYRILEVSADLADRQRDCLEREAPEHVSRVEWVGALPERIRGAVVANEVLDALPVHLVVWHEDGIAERGVVCGTTGFEWSDRSLVRGVLHDTAKALALQPPYLSEIAMQARALVATLAERLEHGLLLFIDYGFGRHEYYHPQRSSGTLMCHYCHRAHADPFFLPGLQDITAHVDFTAIAEAGIDAGTRLAGYTTQAQFLINCGITELLLAADPARTGAYLPAVAGAQKLLSPAEMGELFKAIALTRGMQMPLRGFRAGDKSRLL